MRPPSSPLIAALVLCALPPAIPRGHAACDPTDADAAAVADARADVAATCDCATAPSHRRYVRCAAGVVRRRVASGRLREACASAVHRCATRSTCGRRGYVTCYRTGVRGTTRCAVTRGASRCRAPRDG